MLTMSDPDIYKKLVKSSLNKLSKNVQDLLKR